jgi:hypothetical protein
MFGIHDLALFVISGGRAGSIAHLNDVLMLDLLNFRQQKTPH